MSFAMRQLIAAAAALGVVAVAALAVYKTVVAERAVYPIVEAVEAVKALKPVQLPDYVPIYVLEVHYEEAEGRYVLMPGPSPPNCTSCIPPRGWLYSVSFGGNASPIYGVYYDAHNNTLWLGHVAVMPPYFDNGVLYYIYPACRGGYYLSERLFQSASTKPPVAVVLLSCS